ncbi:hypothetical protein D3C80_1571190 [compost metagenome]
MQLGLDRKLRRGEQVPHHEGSLDIGIQAVAAVIRQAQLRTGEVARALGQGQAPTQLGVHLRVAEQRIDRLARLPHLHLPPGQVAIVIQGAATAEPQQRRQQRNPAPTEGVDKRVSSTTRHARQISALTRLSALSA